MLDISDCKLNFYDFFLLRKITTYKYIGGHKTKLSHIVRGIERSDVGYVKRAFKKFLKMGFFESEMRNRDYYFSLKREYIKRVFELIEKNSCPYCSDYLKKKDFCNYCKKEISQE